MGVYGYLWVSMGRTRIYGHLWVFWVHMGVYMYLWVFMGIYGCLWVSRCLWVSMSVYGCHGCLWVLWMSMGVYGYLWVSMGVMRVYAFLGVSGWLWVSMDTYGYLWVLMGIYECPWVSWMLWVSIRIIFQYLKYCIFSVPKTEFKNFRKRLKSHMCYKKLRMHHGGEGSYRIVRFQYASIKSLFSYCYNNYNDFLNFWKPEFLLRN